MNHDLERKRKRFNRMAVADMTDAGIAQGMATTIVNCMIRGGYINIADEDWDLEKFHKLVLKMDASELMAIRNFGKKCAQDYKKYQSYISENTEKTIGEIFDTLTDEQKDAVAMVCMEAAKNEPVITKEPPTSGRYSWGEKKLYSVLYDDMALSDSYTLSIDGGMAAADHYESYISRTKGGFVKSFVTGTSTRDALNHFWAMYDQAMEGGLL